MKIGFANLWLRLILLSAALESVPINGQGTITFDGQPLWSGTSYSELGMAFQVVVPQGSSQDDMVIVPANWANNVPQDDTPFMGWFRQNNPFNYVSLSLTNGSSFGLTSIQVADPNSPSFSPISISFIGYLSGGGSVTNTFTTPGNGATTFLNYSFTPEFASGLTSVDILAPKWAMDNLVFTVPEPSTVSFILFGGGVCMYVRHRNRKRP